MAVRRKRACEIEHLLPAGRVHDSADTWLAQHAQTNLCPPSPVVRNELVCMQPNDSSNKMRNLCKRRRPRNKQQSVYKKNQVRCGS